MMKWQMENYAHTSSLNLYSLDAFSDTQPPLSKHSNQ